MAFFDLIHEHYVQKKGRFISESLEEKKNDDNEMSSVNYESISNLLNDDLFHLQISFLSIIIKIFNIANQRWVNRIIGKNYRKMKRIIGIL